MSVLGTWSHWWLPKHRWFLVMVQAHQKKGFNHVTNMLLMHLNSIGCTYLDVWCSNCNSVWCIINRILLSITWTTHFHDAHGHSFALRCHNALLLSFLMNVKTMCQGSTKSPDHNPAEHVLSSALKPSSKLSEYTLFWKNGVYYSSIVQYSIRCL